MAKKQSPYEPGSNQHKKTPKASNGVPEGVKPPSVSSVPAGFNKFPTHCVDCGGKMPAGHGRLAKQDGKWVCSCAPKGLPHTRSGSDDPLDAAAFQRRMREYDNDPNLRQPTGLSSYQRRGGARGYHERMIIKAKQRAACDILPALTDGASGFRLRGR